MKYYLGIDLGGTNIATGVIQEDYTMLAKHSVPTAYPRSAEAIVEDMALAGRAVLEKAGLTEKDIEYVGVGVPSTVNQFNHRVVFANNLNWRDYDMIAEFQKNWDIPVFLGNDADAAALGEVMACIGREYENAMMITLGTGLGGGIILNNRLFTGGDGLGCEPGHTIIVADGQQCTCGKKGCLEAYASVTALVRDTIRAMGDYPDSIMRDMTGNDITKVTGRTAFDAAKKGDVAGQEVVKNFIHYLAVGIGSMATLLRPQAVILGGGVCNEGENLFKPLREEVSKLVYAGDIIGSPKLVKATLGNDAGIIGAALLGAQDKL